MGSKDDKLLRLMKDSGLFDPDDGNSSESDWTPENHGEGKRKKRKYNKIFAKHINEGRHTHFSYQDSRMSQMIMQEDSDRTSCDSDSERIIETTNIVTTNAEIHNQSASSMHALDTDDRNANDIADDEIVISDKTALEPCLLNLETGILEDVSTLNIETGSLNDEINQEIRIDKRQLLNFETGEFEDIDITGKETGSLDKVAGTPKQQRINPVTGFLEDALSSASETETNYSKKRGKKRKPKPGTWKKNKIIKHNLKKHVMQNIPECRCECKKKNNTREAKEVFDKFINLQSHTEQNIYLQGCLQEAVPQRFRPRKDIQTKTRRVFKYFVTKKNGTVEVCQKTFLNIHGIKRERLQFKVQHPEKDIRDGRGRHSNHPTYNEETISKVHKFIDSLPARESRYSRSANKFKKYLDSNLTIAELHRKFMTTYPENEISYEKFRQIFNEDFNISFGQPRKDICSTCTKNKVLKDAAENKNSQEIAILEKTQELHLRKAEVFLKRISKAEKEHNETILSLCMDYQKNLSLPVTNIGDEYYLRQLWFHNFGVHNLQDNTATMYVYTEQYALKGPNEVISALNDYIENNKKPNQTELHLYCDNCFSQNKNRFLFTFLDQLCARGDFKKICIFYPVPGHSMMPVDRDFALIERKRLKCDKIYTPDYYINLIKASRNINKYDVVFLEKNLSSVLSEERTVKVKDYKRMYDNRIKASIPGISKCRQVQFFTNSRPALAESMTTSKLKPISLYRTGLSRLIRGSPENCYEAPLVLKPAKIADITNLLQYVPESLRHFYDDIVTKDTSRLVEIEEVIDEIE